MGEKRSKPVSVNASRSCATEGCRGKIPHTAHHATKFCQRCHPPKLRAKWRKQAAARYGRVKAKRKKDRVQVARKKAAQRGLAKNRARTEAELAERKARRERAAAKKQQAQQAQ